MNVMNVMGGKLGRTVKGRRRIVFEVGLLRKTFGPKRDEVTGEWTKLHSEELHNLYPYQIIVMKLVRVRWTCGMHTRDEKLCTEETIWRDRGVDGRIILIRNLKKWSVKERTVFVWLRLWTSDKPI